MVRATILRNSASPPPVLSLAPLPPAPAHDAQTPIDDAAPARDQTPFDELPMSHLISFPPALDSPIDPVDSTSPFDGFGAAPAYSQPYPSPSSPAAFFRDAFDYYRISNAAPFPSMAYQGPALKPQLHHQHRDALQDFADQLVAFSAPPPPPPPQQQQQQSPPQRCIPTSQLFPALTQPLPKQQPSPPAEDTESHSPSSVSSALSTPQPAKKRPPRAAISTKDFVPPDVSGLSKREARLVKNRAAAFLSRQRKREEFEHMEIRVAQLEQENARLLALTQSQSPAPSSSAASSPAHVPKSEPSDDAEELATLRGALAQARSRAERLESELTRLRASSEPGSPVQVKREDTAVATTATTTTSTGTGSALTNSNSKRAGLIGVVLLCALPSLLAAPAAPSAITWPAPGMDMDLDGSGAHLPLSFLNAPSSSSSSSSSSSASSSSSLYPTAAADLLLADAQTQAEFDVSVAPAALPGKLRVRIESPEDAWELDVRGQDAAAGLLQWDGFSAAGPLDSMAAIGRRRVRIALKNRGTEDGEWEVELR